ncbi:upstream-binding factor 1-like protein 1 [Phodopus roborovskii]|uniref:Ubtfl1 protein n=1 Tax=Phodopus roborovskii TaxID=109678 RepID=A0AAU9YQ08_PHORO|nr:upstream-binding factor 1-like protein 1 [Phodopus roborovskii]CAH6777422.1 Ubtfl1 [Phodopus roborovskii]
MPSFDKQHHWSERDIMKLLECIKNNVPSDDSQPFRKTQEDLDWDKVAFKHFSGEMCKQKWMQISHNLRKFRTLSELVLEASKLIKEPPKSKTVKKHPDFPKRPLTAYLRFYKEQRAKYCEMYPKYNNLQLTKILAEKYNQLPEEIKQKYIQEFQKDKQVFREKVNKFRENHPDIERSKKSVVPRNNQAKVRKKSQGGTENMKSTLKTEFPKTFPPVMKFQGEPKKPPMNGYHKFHQDSWSSLCYLSLRERQIEISRRWQQVPESLRKRYNSQAEELQKQYWVDMDLWLKGLSAEEYAAYKEAQATYGKGKNFGMSRGTGPKCPTKDSPTTIPGHVGDSQAFTQDMMEDGKEEDSSSSSDSSSTDEDEDDGHLS